MSAPQPGAPGQPVTEDAFITDHDAADSGGDDDDDDNDKKSAEKKAGRRKIKIEFIQDKSRRHITFSKRKAGIMKKAYELSTLTGTQVLLLVVSETGLVYTFTTAKLQPLVTQPEGKNLIQACLNAPHGTLPSSMPVGAPIGRSANQMSNMPPPPGNMAGGLAIAAGGSKGDDDDGDEEEVNHAGRPAGAGEKRRRRGSSAAGPNSGANRGGGGQTSPHSPNASIPPAALNIAPHQSGQPPQQQPGQISLGGSPTSPQQQHQQVAPNPQYQPSPGSYGHHQPQHHHGGGDPGMYSAHMMPPPSGPYAYGSGGPGGAGTQQGMTGLAQAAHQQGHWAGPPPPQQVNQHYARR